MILAKLIDSYYYHLLLVVVDVRGVEESGFFDRITDTRSDTTHTTRRVQLIPFLPADFSSWYVQFLGYIWTGAISIISFFPGLEIFLIGRTVLSQSQ